MIKNKTLFLFLLLGICSSFAEEKISPLSQNLRGKFQYTWFFMDIYQAKLWAPNDIEVFSVPFTLELIYSRDFDGEDIVNQSIKELTGQGLSREYLEKKKEVLLEIFPNIKEGDSIMAQYTPEKGTVFYLNQKKKLGSIVDKTFSVEFLNIWLGEKTSSPELRAALLGSKD